jgi:hypothetical protein
LGGGHVSVVHSGAVIQMGRHDGVSQEFSGVEIQIFTSAPQKFNALVAFFEDFLDVWLKIEIMVKGET